MRAARAPSDSSAGRAASTGGAPGSWGGGPARQPEMATALASPSPMATTATTLSLVRDMILSTPYERQRGPIAFPWGSPELPRLGRDHSELSPRPPAPLTLPFHLLTTRS